MNPWNLAKIKKIKGEYSNNPEQTKENYPQLFYYFDGIINTKINQSRHPAGIIASPINLIDNYGMFIGEDGQYILPINMEEIHEINLAKYDILGLKNIGIIRKCCEYANIKYPLSHEVNWDDLDVYKDMIKSPIGIFQFEGDYAFKLLNTFIELNINDKKRTPTVDCISLVNASLRPSGESYRDKLLNGIPNINPSKIIDDLLEDNMGYLVYQCDVIKFLQQICGLSGSEADNVRRAIGRKQVDRLQKAMPSILEGYCKVSEQPRAIAEEEAKQFLAVIDSASSYMFGFNHSTGYSMVSYLCAYMRYYYPTEFCTAYLNCADGQSKDQDILDGTRLAQDKGIVVTTPKFRISLSDFVCDAKTKTIYKGLGSIKDIGKDVGDALYTLKDNHYPTFVHLLVDIKKLSINAKQLDILIKIDYFSEFGHINQLIEMVKVYTDLSAMFNKIKTCKQLHKKDLFLPIEEVKQCCNSETDKMFKEIDNSKLIKVFNKHYKQLLADTIAKYPFSPTTDSDRIYYELKLLGYTSIINEQADDSIYAVSHIEQNQWGTTFVSLYQLNSGITTTHKVDKSYLRENVFEVGDVLRCVFITKEKKTKLLDDDGKEVLNNKDKCIWVGTGEYDEILSVWCKSN